MEPVAASESSTGPGGAGRRAPAPPDDAQRPLLSLLIPAYNERLTVLGVIERVRAVPFPCAFEIIVVDDGSTDGTTDILRAKENGGQPFPPAGVRVFFHERNRGKGAAVQTALEHVRGEIVVIQDADEELDPTDILPLLAEVRSGRPVCYGSRFMRDTARFRFKLIYWANRTLTLMSNLLAGQTLTDMNTCYKMMRTDIARRLALESRGFTIEPEITVKLARLGLPIVEVPIRYKPRDRAAGKKIRSRDFVRYIVAMLRFRFSRSFRGNAKSGGKRG
ncbi:Undecaprenyl-phosphate mannosyltransferase [Phycisphaerae bacterium RAS1]|nr:Undecaprenyl-phosphate mannosyltransferase [Phycisphaerae bacterium RAS1]